MAKHLYCFYSNLAPFYRSNSNSNAILSETGFQKYLSESGYHGKRLSESGYYGKCLSEAGYHGEFCQGLELELSVSGAAADSLTDRSASALNRQNRVERTRFRFLWR